MFQHRGRSRKGRGGSGAQRAAAGPDVPPPKRCTPGTVNAGREASPANGTVRRPMGLADHQAHRDLLQLARTNGFTLQGGPRPHSPAVARGHRATSPVGAEAPVPLAFAEIAASSASAHSHPVRTAAAPSRRAYLRSSEQPKEGPEARQPRHARHVEHVSYDDVRVTLRQVLRLVGPESFPTAHH